MKGYVRHDLLSDVGAYLGLDQLHISFLGAVQRSLVNELAMGVGRLLRRGGVPCTKI